MIRFFRVSFSSAHFYSQPAWNEEKNREVFGLCHHPFGHGHDYSLHVGFEDNDKLNPQEISAGLQQIILPLDHQHLNHDVEFFKENVPTTENIAQYLTNQIQKKWPDKNLKKLLLFERDDIWVEVDFE